MDAWLHGSPKNPWNLEFLDGIHCEKQGKFSIQDLRFLEGL